MYLKDILLISCLFTLAGFVSACEGECIVQITKAFLGNYSAPIQAVFGDMSQQISTELLPPSRRPSDPMSLVQPILTSYSQISYDTLEDAIFPSYFHGKCQRFSKDGQDPPGCPNPDCPVVCGTPGSMVHFYSTLRYIAFNSTKTTLEKLTTPDSDAYKKVDTLVQDAQGVRKRTLPATHGMGAMGVPGDSKIYKRILSSFLRFSDEASALQSSPASSPDSLASILDQFDDRFVAACGGNARDSTDALPECSWEAEMKAYILTFP